MLEIQAIVPANLLIDEQNPRIAIPNEGQHKALQSLAEHLKSKLSALASHIVAHGINPSDLPIVMPVPNRPGFYIVLEGNRRIAALRAMETPEAIRGVVPARVLKRIRDLSKDYLQNPVESINCVVVQDRDEARPWIKLRHTGQNAGAGTVSWEPDEAHRFDARTGKPKISFQALEFLQERGDLSTDLRQKLPFTSFRRLLGTPAVRSRLGVEVDKGVLYLLADPKRVSKAFMYVIRDLANKNIKVKDIYDERQRAAYAAKLPRGVAVKSTVQSGQGTPASASVGDVSPTKASKARTPRKRDRLIPGDCVLDIPSGRISDIEVELQKLSLDNYTNAVSVLFRVFVELSVDTYIDDEQPAGVTSDDKLRKKIEGVSIDLQAKKKLNKQQARAIRSANVENSFLAPGVATMHDYVHNLYVFPAPTDLRQHWNSLQPFMKAIWTA